jgi:hypothetical protein
MLIVVQMELRQRCICGDDLIVVVFLNATATMLGLSTAK